MLNKSSSQNYIQRFEGSKCLFGPFNFTIVNVKKGPAIIDSASYGPGSCPFTKVITVPS